MLVKLSEKTECQVGIISDTHGHLSESAVKGLAKVDLIIHAGDIDSAGVLPVLKKIAPLVAVRGNMDFGPWAAKLPETEAIQVGGMWLYILHDLSRLGLSPKSAGFGVVISGHTHRPQFSEQNGTLFINPGSATFPRHPASASMAILRIQDNQATARLINLDPNRCTSTSI